MKLVTLVNQVKIVIIVKIPGAYMRHIGRYVLVEASHYLLHSAVLVSIRKWN